MPIKDYETGYGKPPKATQFKKGNSGNPQGRPKGAKNLATDLKEELEEKIRITEGGQTQEVTKQRAMLKALLAKALKGDSRAATALITLKLSLEQSEGAHPADKRLSDDDKALLDQYAARILEKETPEEDPS
jgi:hypothetical protein